MQTNAMVFKLVLAVLLLTCCVAGIEAQVSAAAVANKHDLKITSHTDDFAIENQRQYAANIVSMTEELAFYKKNFDNQLLAMETQKALLEANIKETQKRLQPLELLNDMSKHCVQKYYHQIATVATVNTGITNCVTHAQSFFAGIVSAAQTTITNLNRYYNEQLVATLAACKKTHGNAQLNYTLCVTQTISSANAATSSNLKQFKTEMETVTCTGNGRVKLAVDCGYNIVYATVSKIGEISRLIDDCVLGKEFCPPCPIMPPPTHAPECPNGIVLKLTAKELQNATISNPFVGVSTDCVRVKFVDPTLQ